MQFSFIQQLSCDAIKQNESEVEQMKFLVLNATFSRKPTKIGWLAPEMQAVEGYAFEDSDSLCMIPSHTSF